MDGDHIGISVEGEMVAGVQLLAAHGADFAVDQHVTFLDNGLGHTAGFHGVGILQRCIQLNKFRANIDRNGSISFLTTTFIGYSFFI